jgi:hypothetical protein
MQRSQKVFLLAMLVVLVGIVAFAWIRTHSGRSSPVCATQDCAT